MKMTAGVKKKQRRRHRQDLDSATSRFISESSSDSDFEVRIPNIKYADYKKKTKGFSSTEKSLLAVIIVCIVVCVVLAALLVVQFIVNFRNKTCSSPNCVEVAGSLIAKMNLSEKPCEDFYQYSCGTWINTLTLPPDKSRYSMFTDVDERNTGRLNKLLSTPGNKLLDQESTAVQKAKNFYKACMDTQATEERGTAPLLKLIKKFGSWTVTNDELSGKFDPLTWNLLNNIVAVHSTVSSPFFDMSVGTDNRNVDENIIQFDQSGLTFADRSFYLEEAMAKKYQKAFRDYFITVSVLMGGDNATASQVADDIWNLETRIAEIMTPEEDRQDMEKLYHKMKLNDIQTIMGDWIDMKTYAFRIFGFSLEKETDVVLYAPEYFGKLGDIIRSTSNSTLANYLVWQGIDPGLSHLPYSFQQANLALKSALFGVSARPPQWKLCVAKTNSLLPQASGALFVEKFFSEEDKEKASSILENIKKEFKAQLPHVSWMNAETRKKALEKANAINNKVGYPAMAKDPEKLDLYYKKMRMTPDDDFQNWLNANDFYIKKNLLKLYQKPDRDEWFMSPATVNAYYSPTTNEMVFPAAILQAPFYDPQYPMAVNYGAIGMVMGHELTHGFDNNGRQYDEYGNLHNWWDQASADAFLNRTQCLINQYNLFKVGNKTDCDQCLCMVKLILRRMILQEIKFNTKVNGKLTQGENIADNGGIKTAYGAYSSWLKEHGSKEENGRLPGLQMTEKQLFFLGFGQIWCTYATPQYAEQSLATDVHSPAQYRVLGSLTNDEEFSNTFSCPSGSAMNPKEKCRVW